MDYDEINSIKIMGEYFRLTLTDKKVRLGKKFVYGRADFNKNEITVWDVPHKEENIIHEILEIITTKLLIKISHDDLFKLGSGLLAVIKDNDKLFVRLTRIPIISKPVPALKDVGLANAIVNPQKGEEK